MILTLHALQAPQHRAKIMGINQAVAGSVWIIGPAIGGALLSPPAVSPPDPDPNLPDALPLTLHLFCVRLACGDVWLSEFISHCWHRVQPNRP